MTPGTATGGAEVGVRYRGQVRTQPNLEPRPPDPCVVSSRDLRETSSFWCAWDRVVEALSRLTGVGSRGPAVTGVLPPKRVLAEHRLTRPAA